MADLPVGWPGYAVLLNGDRDHDLSIDEEEKNSINWIAFSEAVEAFQKEAGLRPVDSKLGKDTLMALRKHYGITGPAGGLLREIGDLKLKAASEPTAPPSGARANGVTNLERRLALLWNNYGGAIARQAKPMGIPVAAALAVFSVESGTAYDSGTGLVILRYEPHIFRRESGGMDVAIQRGGQSAEWGAFERAYAADPKAALRSCSWGLGQVMGFNYDVTPHATPKAMVLAFQDSCAEQIGGFFGFVKKRGLAPLIKAKDWAGFALRYNGSNFREHLYDSKMADAYKTVEAMRIDGAAIG